MKIQGNNFYAIWCCNKQIYTVYNNENKMIITNKYKFSDIKSYLI